ncbi:MAG TPA: hypothetical protein VGT60_12020 [Candidatus Limnocylindria bacterium]|nr:hypothetical protein [Candidatus Limnocylindria bacterium]
MGRKRSRAPEVLDSPVDLASRIGGAAPAGPVPAAPETVRRVDGPIESARAVRERPVLMIGANEAPASGPIDARPQEQLAAAAGPMLIGLEEALVVATAPPAAPEPVADDLAAQPPLVTVREAPAPGEMDLVVTPLATPDDWHHFELALRRVPGVGPLRIEYYRAGILKLRLQWSGPERFAYAVASVPGYRVGILGEDRSTVQIRVARH